MMYDDLPIKQVIFHSYVKQPDGKHMCTYIYIFLNLYLYIYIYVYGVYIYNNYIYIYIYIYTSSIHSRLDTY